jgi:hypothetical protein
MEVAIVFHHFRFLMVEKRHETLPSAIYILPTEKTIIKNQIIPKSMAFCPSGPR